MLLQHGWKFEHPPSATLVLFPCETVPPISCGGRGFYLPLHPGCAATHSFTNGLAVLDVLTHLPFKFEMAPLHSCGKKALREWNLGFALLLLVFLWCCFGDSFRFIRTRAREIGLRKQEYQFLCIMQLKTSTYVGHHWPITWDRSRLNIAYPAVQTRGLTELESPRSKILSCCVSCCWLVTFMFWCH